MFLATRKETAGLNHLPKAADVVSATVAEVATVLRLTQLGEPATREMMTVPIKIIQTEQGYIAQLTPPAVSIVTPAITEHWETAEPMTREALRAKLLELGAHPHDIEDAFAYSDPNWTPPVSDPAGSRRRFGDRRPPGYSNPEG